MSKWLNYPFLENYLLLVNTPLSNLVILIVAVDQFITVTVEEARKNGSIQFCPIQRSVDSLDASQRRISLDHRDNPFHYILAAIRLTEKYAQEKGIPLSFYDLKVTSELITLNGRKYGLGSSGAVTVATVKALNLYYQMDMDRLTQFKIAALAHLAVQGNGSCGDIAASLLWRLDRFFNLRSRLGLSQTKDHTLTELIADWPGLSIRPLTVPKSLRLLIGWTGSPASTSDLVDQVYQLKKKKKTPMLPF